MKNKKGFAIMPKEILGLAVILILGLATWFFYSGVQAWIEENFNWSPLKYMVTGVFIIMIVLLVTKFKPQKIFFG